MPKSPTIPTQCPSPQWAKALHEWRPRHSCRGGRPPPFPPASAVPIIPLPSLTPSSFAFRHVAECFHIRTEKLCYQSQLFTLHKVSRVVYVKRPVSISNNGCGKFPIIVSVNC